MKNHMEEIARALGIEPVLLNIEADLRVSKIEANSERVTVEFAPEPPTDSPEPK